MARIIPANTLLPPKAPNLLYPPKDYAQQYHELLNNALRIYFNELDNTLGALLGTAIGGGSFLRFPHGSFFQNGHTDLTAAMTNVSTTPIQVTSTANFESSGYLFIGSEFIQYTGKTATTFTGITRGVLGTTNVAHAIGTAVTESAATAAGGSAGVKLDTTSYSYGVSFDTTNKTRIYFDYPGIYNLQFSAQLVNFTTTDDNVTFWLRKNGTDVPYTAGIAAAVSKHGTSPGAAIVSWNFLIDTIADDYYELYWASESGNTALSTYPAGTAPVHPVSPSVIVTVTFVSGLTS